MTPEQRRWLQRAQRRVAHLEPSVRAAYLQALEHVLEQVTDEQLTAATQSGDVARLFDALLSDAELDKETFPVRQEIRRTLQRAFQAAAIDVPTSHTAIDATGGRLLAARFDWLSPTVTQAVTTLESRALTTLKQDIRATVRDAVARGIASGAAPKTIAKDLRSVIGLAPNQAQYLANLRAELEAGQYGAARQRALLDQRFNLTKLDDLSAAARAHRIDTIVETYRKRLIAHNTSVNANLVARDAYREGQRLAWLQAEQDGLIPDGYQMQKTWVHLDPQPHPRPEHQALDGETVPIAQPYSTGQMSAGLGDYGCHCLDRYTIARAA